MNKEKINDLIIEKGGPISTIEFLISEISDENINQTSEYIKHILSIRYVSKKTYIGGVNFYDYLINNGINIK